MSGVMSLKSVGGSHVFQARQFKLLTKWQHLMNWSDATLIVMLFKHEVIAC